MFLRVVNFTHIQTISGDSYDNALDETVNDLYKIEVIEYLKSDWTSWSAVELVILNWVDWFNKKRLHSLIGCVSPFEYEAKINLLAQVV